MKGNGKKEHTHAHIHTEKDRESESEMEKKEASYSLVPQDGRGDGTSMPQAVGVEAAPQGGEVEELERHGEHDPGDGEARPDGPALVGSAPPADAVGGPEGVLDDAHHHVGRHVVRIVPADEGEVGDVGGEERGAERRPGAEDYRVVPPPPPTRPGAGVAAGGQARQADDGVVQAVEH